MTKKYNIVIIGAGAAGMFAAKYARQNGHSVAVIDMGNTPGRKVAVSGGGRCNFTNLAVAPDRYFGNNKNFVRGALARFTPSDMINWMHQHKFKIVEKAAGQYFCANGAIAVVNELKKDVRDSDFILNTTVTGVDKHDKNFIVHTSGGDITSDKVIVATGGTSFATLGVSDIGYKIAKHFGHKIVPVRPALCAMKTNVFPHELSGISLPVAIHTGHETIYDDLLFTHFGIGGPAVYRATVRNIEKNITIDFAPNTDIYEFLHQIKQTNGKKSISAALAQVLPERVARWVCDTDCTSRIADIRDTELRKITERIKHVVVMINDIQYHSLASAEVVRGGVDTADISSKTMESKLCPGLYFIGEVLDIAGDLGGFNLHWAWASGFTAGNAA